MVPSVLTPQLCQPPALTCVKAPAGREPAGVLTPGAHLGESARGRGRLPVSVAAPAGDRPVGGNPAGVQTARAHLGEGARWRRCLAVGVVSPADDGAVA